MQDSVKETSKGCLMLATIIIVGIVLTPIGLLYLGGKTVRQIWKAFIGFLANGRFVP